MAKQTKAWLEWKPAGWVPKVAREHRKAVFNSMAQAMDSIRMRAAFMFIIPNRTGTKHPYWSSMAQHSDPVCLTDRTGSLIKMLKDKAGLRHKWTVTASKAKIDTMGMQGMIKVLGGALTPMEQYVATFRVNIQESAIAATKVMGAIPNHKKGRRNRIVQTKQTLRMRFRHETGIRGNTRPFMEPAAKQQVFAVQKLIQARIDQYTRRM